MIDLTLDYNFLNLAGIPQNLHCSNDTTPHCFLETCVRIVCLVRKIIGLVNSSE